MTTRTTSREAPAPPPALRAPRGCPLSQEQVEDAILDWLGRLGPMTRGEILWKCFDFTVKAAQRDEAIASLQKRGFVRIGKQKLRNLNRSIPVVELAPSRPRRRGQR